MTPTIEIDDLTYRSLEFAALMANSTASEMVARLVEQASVPQPTPGPDSTGATRNEVAIFADYEGHRTQALYDPDTTRIDITGGPLRGTSHKTPTGAARAVVAHYKPKINPNRNGWSFWTLDDGSGRLLQSIRKA